MDRIAKKMRSIGVIKYMNPPGDGLCYFHCAVEHVNPGIRTKIERVRRAIQMQRSVMQYVWDKIQDTTQNADANMEKYRLLMSWENIGSQAIRSKMKAEMEELWLHPTRYMKDIVEVIQFEAAHVLGITIETHRVTDNADGTYVDSIDRYNEGCQHTMRLLWDPQGEHYILIKQMEGEQSLAREDGAEYVEARTLNEGGMEESDRIICYIIKKEMGFEDYPDIDTTKPLMVRKPKERQVMRGYTLYEQDAREMSREEIDKVLQEPIPALRKPPHLEEKQPTTQGNGTKKRKMAPPVKAPKTESKERTIHTRGAEKD